MSDLRTALEEAFNTDDTPEPVIEKTPEVTPEPTPEPVARDESGRFAAKESPEPIPESTEPAPAPRANPFSSWKPAAQEAFRKAEAGEVLTSEETKILRAEAERREGDWHKGLSEFKSHAERAKNYDQVLAPYQGYLQKMGVDAPTAINALMRADMTLRTSDPATKARYFNQLAKEYGIELGDIEAPPPVDPQTKYLMDQLQGLQQQQVLWQNQIQAQEHARVSQEIDAFKGSAPHLEAVRGDMADLLESGKAKSLQEAYEMAVWMRPDTRQTLVEQQRIEAQRTALEQAQTQRAKSAAVSVKGSSPTSAGNQPVKGTLRDILAAQFAD